MPGLSDPTSLEHCFLELVLNSLKAQATAIAIRINLRERKIQVVDNGSGISKNALRYFGEYTTKREDHQGTSERSLVKIRRLSSHLIIMSRSKFTTETYGKCFSNGKVPKMQRIENRPSCGTTVTVYASSKSCNWSGKINSFALKFIIIYLSLVNRQVSFSVRDDMGECILLGVEKRPKQSHLLGVIFEQPVSSGQVRRIKTQIIGKLKISGFWGVECTEYRKIQQVLLNLRPVHCPSLEKFMIGIVTKICYPCEENADPLLEKIFFLVYIECLDSEYNVSVKDNKLTVDLHQIDRILDSLGKCFGKTEAKELEQSKAVARKSIIPPITSHWMGRILGVKQKRSFLTKVTKHSFQKTTLTTAMQRMVKALPEIEKFSTMGRENSNLLNRNTVSPVPQRISLNDSAPTKEHECDDSRVSQASQECIEKISKHDKKEPPPAKPNTNRDINVSSKNDEYEKRRISKVSEKSVEKSLPITQSQIASVLVNERNCYNYASKVNQRLIESRNIYELPIISQHWPSDYTEAVEKNCKSQPSAEESEKGISESLQKLECKIADEILPTVKEYRYDNHGVLWISQKCNEKLSNRMEETYDIDCSQWSNWTYEPDRGTCIGEKPCEVIRPVLYKRFRFLPLNLHALLPYLNEKLTNRDLSEDVRVPLNLNFNHRRQDLDVRPCTRRSLEFRLKIESLKSMKVLNQVNQEFIVALTKQDDKKLVVVVDQHAMHERIRYENLLRVTLHRPIIISDLSTSTCSLLSSNQALLARYGLNLAFRNEVTLLIFAVPRCFLKKTFRADNTEVEIAVRKLLQEVSDNLATDGTKKFLPFTIHDAIASEACHGAIRFGDPLTLKQCESLISCWTETDAPNRCAHGRPSVVPLLELSSHRRNHYEFVCQGRLNFASLRKFRRETGKRRNTTLRYHPYITLPESRAHCDVKPLL